MRICESWFFVMHEFGHLQMLLFVMRHPGNLIPVNIGLLIALSQHLSQFAQFVILQLLGLTLLHIS